MGCQRNHLHQHMLGAGAMWDPKGQRQGERERPQTLQGFRRFVAQPGLQIFSLGFCH